MLAFDIFLHEIILTTFRRVAYFRAYTSCFVVVVVCHGSDRRACALQDDSSTIYAGYQEFDFDFLNFKRKNFNKKTLKISNNFFFFNFFFAISV
jgi:hypothetical protein